MQMKNNVLIIAGIVWAIIVGVGLTKLYDYEFQSEPRAEMINRWPANSSIQTDDKKFHLVLALHPHCPCSRATLNELASIMTKARGSLSAYILFVKPPKFSEQWVKSDLYNTALRIPDSHVFIDENSKESRLFKATTSGQTFLFNDQGELLFSGGITSSRGHEGDSIGKSAIMDILQNKVTHVMQQPPAFGCFLHEKDG
jgi:hypothetical protein